MDHCETIKVKPWGEGQGEFVEINATDFDPAIHQLYETTAETPAPKPTRARKA